MDTKTLIPVALALGTLATSLGAQNLIHRLDAPGGTGFGEAIARVGDLDGDGVAEFVVGAPRYDTSSGTDSGLVHVISGRTGARLHRINGPSGGSRLGTSVAGIGDFNGDGWPDYAIGAPGYGGRDPVGYAAVRSGYDGRVIASWIGEMRSGFGTSVASVGDLTGDGRPELVVGAPYRSWQRGPFGIIVPLRSHGAAWVYSSSNYQQIGMLVGSRSIGGASDAQFASWMANVGDADGDGKDDLAVIDRYDFQGNSPGFVWCFGTASRLGRMWGRSGEFRSVAGRIDPNADGRSDVIVGIPSADQIQLLSGVDGSVLANVGRGTSGQFGYSVSGGEDVDGDGAPDIVVGAPRIGGIGGTGGEVYVYDGVASSHGSIVQLFRVASGTLEQFGLSVAALGDIDGRGRGDVAVGAPRGSAGIYDLVHAYGWDAPGTATSFGAGCRGYLSAPMLLSNRSQSGIRPGGSILTRSGSGAPGESALMLLGLSNTAFGALPLPLSLAPLGMPGCSLLVSPDIPVPGQFSAVGYHYVTLPFPPSTPVGFQFYLQSLAIDPGGSLAGFALSNGLEVTVGEH